MGNLREASRRAKPGVVQALVRHRELNPVAGRPFLIAEDTATGQLFICAPVGSCVKRDRAARGEAYGRFDDDAA